MVVPNASRRDRSLRWIIFIGILLISAAVAWLLLRCLMPKSPLHWAARAVVRAPTVLTPPFTIAGNMNEARAAFAAVGAGTLCVAVGGLDAEGHALATWEAFDPIAGCSVRSGTLPEARTGVTATLLPDERVFIAGGWDGKTYADRCLILDPATGTLTEGPKLRFPRRDAAAVALAGGVLIVGGGDEDAGFEYYDAATGQLKHGDGPFGDLRGAALVGWSTDAPDLPGGQGETVDLPNGERVTIDLGAAQRVTLGFLVGGRRKDGTVSAETWLLDTSTMKAKANKPMNVARADGCVVDAGDLYIAGGIGVGGQALRSIERFDLDSKSFVQAEDLEWPVASGVGGGYQVLSDVYWHVVVGGDGGRPSAATQEIITGAISMRVSRGPELNVARYAPQLVLVRIGGMDVNGHGVSGCGLVVMGGIAAEGRPTAACEERDLYGTFSEVKKMVGRRPLRLRFNEFPAVGSSVAR